MRITLIKTSTIKIILANNFKFFYKKREKERSICFAIESDKKIHQSVGSL